MPKPLVYTKKIAPDEVQVTVIDYAPTPQEKVKDAAEPLIRGLIARDACGDGTDEYELNEPCPVWRSVPVLYYLGPTVPLMLQPVAEESFKQYNNTAGFELYKRTDNSTQAKIIITLGPIDVSGSTLARASWNYSPSTLTITKASITFDTSEAWGKLSQESCGSTGNIFDFGNVCVHEVGHLSGLGHAPTDRLQTMYASTSPGKTLGRSLGNGDTKGFKTAYKVTEPTPTPEPTPIPEPTPTPTPAPQPTPAPRFLFKCVVATTPKGKLWKCTMDNGTKTWFAGPDYKWYGWIARYVK